MPKIRRQNLPPALLHHLVDRIRSREISADQLGLFADWLDTEPEVPTDKWFKRFPGMIVCEVVNRFQEHYLFFGTIEASSCHEDSQWTLTMKTGANLTKIDTVCRRTPSPRFNPRNLGLFQLYLAGPCSSRPMLKAPIGFASGWESWASDE